MKAKVKVFSMLLALVMIFGQAMPAFAAEASGDPETTVAETTSDMEIVPMSQGDEITFRLGEVGYISDAGNNPKFEMWVTGGSASTQVKFNITSSGGTNYGPYGPIPADGSQGWYFQHVVIQGGGAWKFTANVTSGPNPGNLVCHVKQVY